MTIPARAAVPEPVSMQSGKPLGDGAQHRVVNLKAIAHPGAHGVLARLSQLAPNNPPGGRFSVMGSCKVGTTGAAVISISEYHPTWALGAVDQAG